uniref:EGF-like domain-containing protein n=1 Tax=Syphacia muris TaxID=451379 RepID=A0A0N5AYL4_9BILA
MVTLLSVNAIDCVYSKECPGDEVCSLGTCQCPEGQMSYQDTCIFKNETCAEIGQILIDGKCFKMAWIHQRCINNKQCLGKSICHNGFCECPLGSTQEGKRCVTPTHCETGKVLIDGKCMETVGVYENCTHNDQCTGGAICVENNCRCPRGPCYGSGDECGYCDWSDVEVKGECYPSANMDEECKLSEQCPYGAQCIAGQCKCPSGTKFEANGCFTTVVNNNCNEKQVFIKVGESGQCYDRVPIGGKCAYNEQCLSDSECVNSVCKCPEGTNAVDGSCFPSLTCKSYEVAVEGKCWDRVSIGSPCNYDKQCIARATCTRMDSEMSATCQCNQNTQFDGVECVERPMIRCPYDWISVDDSSCLPQVPIGSRCITTEQCKGYSECIRGVCNCASGFKEVHKTCRVLKDLVS